jgi:cell division septation protein DedD
VAAGVAGALLAPGLAGPLRAQSPDAELDRIETRIDAGDREARRSVEAWLAQHPRETPERIGRARVLRARLMSDADSARSEYMAVAMEARSSYGARAWLRLAQMDLALGDTRRTLADLERLRTDYRGSPEVVESWYWTARAHEQAGALDDACDAFERASEEAQDARRPELFQRGRAAYDACSSPGLRFSLQVGAFSRADAADEILDALRVAGYPVRLVEEDGLHKVRVGWFASPETARSLERRLRDGGYAVTVVAGEAA